MYTALDQVGGTIGSEEAVGRHILVPNAMLFSQVVINYTVTQDAAYMLDELVVRITFDSDWDEAERILLDAADRGHRRHHQATAASSPTSAPTSTTTASTCACATRPRSRTGPRSPTASRSEIFEAVQRTPKVDMAIPFIYSYRAGLAEMVRTAAPPATATARAAARTPDKEAGNIRQIKVESIHAGGEPLELQDIEQLARSIAEQGLLQPIVVARQPGAAEGYDVLAGHLRLAACKKLGWKTIAAIVRDPAADGRGR